MTSPAITLRRAEPRDSAILLYWRNDPVTRRSSHNQDIVLGVDHDRWFAAVLANPKRWLFIAEVAEGEESKTPIPAGTVRADFGADGECELSWTVSPRMRGKGIGSLMVARVAETITGALRAEVKAGNVQSEAIARRCGMAFDREDAGVRHFRRLPLTAG